MGTRGPKAPQRPRASTALEADQAAFLVPVEAIVPGKNARSAWDAVDERLVRLTESIQEQGILEPLLVRELHSRSQKGATRFELIAGFRRYAAARHLALDRVPVRVLRAADDEALALNLAENLARSDLVDADALGSVAQLQDTYGWGVRRIARATGRSIGWVSEILAVARSGAERDAVERGLIALGGAARLVRLKERFPDVRAKWVRRLRAGEHVPIEDVPRLRDLQPAEEQSPVPEPRAKRSRRVTSTGATPKAERVLALYPDETALVRSATERMSEALTALYAAWARQPHRGVFPPQVREDLERTTWEIAQLLSREAR